MGRSRKRMVVITVAVVGVIAAGWFLRPRNTFLFDRATRVATYDDKLGGRNGFYWWLSIHQVVLAHSSNYMLQSLYCHDTNTGKDDPCVVLNRLIQAQKGAARIEALSPDRRVLLFRGGDDRQMWGSQDGRILFVDSQSADTPNTRSSWSSYMSGSSLWVEPIMAWSGSFQVLKDGRISRLLVHDGTRHTIVKTVTFSPWLEPSFADMITSRNHFLIQKRTTFDMLGAPTSNASLQTIDIDLNVPAPKPQTITLHLPVGSEPYEVCYSPDGERVAFLRVLDNHVEGWLPALLQGWRDRLFQHRTPLTYKVSLWVSDIHGQRMHEVGSLPHDTPFVWVTDGDPQSFQWLPDGKTLSFLAHEAVWTVPAD